MSMHATLVTCRGCDRFPVGSASSLSAYDRACPSDRGASNCGEARAPAPRRAAVAASPVPMASSQSYARLSCLNQRPMLPSRLAPPPRYHAGPWLRGPPLLGAKQHLRLALCVTVAGLPSHSRRMDSPP